MNDNVFFQHGFPQQGAFISNRDYLKSSGTEFTEVDDVFTEQQALLTEPNHVSNLVCILSLAYTVHDILSSNS